MSLERVLTYPCNEENPYQQQLHAGLAKNGVEARFLRPRTPSAAVNLLLLPLELVAARLRGIRVFHVHWLYLFDHPASRRLPFLRRSLRWWLRIVLSTARHVGLRVVWTAHNELPHRPIFDDDVAARALLCANGALVIAHSEQAAQAIIGRGWSPAEQVTVVPHGPMPLPAADAKQVHSDLGLSSDTRLLTFVGRIEEYKGVAELLASVVEMNRDGRWPKGLRVVVAGECREPSLSTRLAELAQAGEDAIRLRLEYIPDGKLANLLAASAMVILPFQTVTTSGSAVLALGAGCPLALPQGVLPELPAQAVQRYEHVSDLIVNLERATDAELAAMSRAAKGWADGWTWDDVARVTAAVYCGATSEVGGVVGHLRRQSRSERA